MCPSGTGEPALKRRRSIAVAPAAATRVDYTVRRTSIQLLLCCVKYKVACFLWCFKQAHGVGFAHHYCYLQVIGLQHSRTRMTGTPTTPWFSSTLHYCCAGRVRLCTQQPVASKTYTSPSPCLSLSTCCSFSGHKTRHFRHREREMGYKFHLQAKPVHTHLWFIRSCSLDRAFSSLRHGLWLVVVTGGSRQKAPERTASQYRSSSRAKECHRHRQRQTRRN